jgi:hypothetical protein
VAQQIAPEAVKLTSQYSLFLNALSLRISREGFAKMEYSSMLLYKAITPSLGSRGFIP